MRRVYQLVAVQPMLLAPKVLDDASRPRTLGVPDDQPRPGLVVDREEVELPSEESMVALLGLLDAVEVLVEGILRLEGRPVDALEHRAVLIAAPIRARHVQQLERRNPPRRFDVRPCTQIFESTVPVRGDLLVLGDLLDDLHLQRLRGVHALGLVARVLVVLERVVLLDHPPHTLFDPRQVLLGERLFHHEVIVEAVVRRRPDAQLRFREHLRDHVGHDMGGRVPYSLSQLD